MLRFMVVLFLLRGRKTLIFHLLYYVGFCGGSDGKASACNVRDPGSITGSGKSPGEENVYSLQYSCLENSMDRGACWATVHGVTKSQKWLSIWACMHARKKLTQHRYIGCPHVLWFMVVLFLVSERKACIFHLMYYVGFSGSSNGKESTCSVGREENVCSLQYSCLENSMDRGGLQSTGSQRVEYSWATNSFTFSRLCAHPGSS